MEGRVPTDPISRIPPRPYFSSVTPGSGRPSAVSKVSDKFVSGLRNNLLPAVSAFLFPKQAQRGIPGAVIALGQPIPYGNSPQHEQCRNAQCACYMGGGVGNGNHHVHCRHLRRKNIQVLHLLGTIVMKNLDPRFGSEGISLLSRFAVLKVDERYSGHLQ
jgi:hypothetical protein